MGNACSMASLPAGAALRLKERGVDGAHGQMQRPRPKVDHNHSATKIAKGVRAQIDRNKAKKAWKDARQGVEAARDARRAAGVEDDDLYELEEAIMAMPAPEEPNIVVSTVQMKLATFCTNPSLRRAINRYVLDMNTMVAEGYAFANFHMTRMLESGGEIPKIDQSFYNFCTGAVTECRSKCGPEMKESARLFDQLRPAAVGRTSMDADARTDVAKGMATMAVNHLWMNLPCYLSKYVQLRYPEVTKALRKTVVRLVAIDTKVPVTQARQLSLVRENGLPLSEAMAGKVEGARSLIMELRSRCPINTVGVAAKAHTLLPLFHDMQAFFEAEYAAAKAASVPDPKRLRTLRKARFSVLPTKRGFTVGSVPLCGRAMAGILTKVKDSQGFALQKNKGRDDGHDASWRKHFNINLVETWTRRFGGSITTDGVKVGVHMNRTQACVLPSKNQEWDPLSYLSNVKGKKPWFSGVDPGFDTVVTVAGTSVLQEPGTGDDKTLRDVKIQSMSSSQYGEKSKLKTSERATRKWNAERSTLVDQMDLETDRSTSEGLGAFTRSYLRVFRPLLHHRAKRGYRRLRFLRYVHKVRTIREICDMIAPADKYTVCGYGDWKSGNGSPISRRFAGPQEDIKRELGRRTNVLLWHMWEYRTSKVCSTTWRELTNMRARKWKYDREQKKMVLTENRERIHKILHCRSSAGVAKRHGGHTWNRDVNASRNILMLMMLVVLGKERPREFLPAVTVGEASEESSSGTIPTT